jgi:hypothetical protein
MSNVSMLRGYNSCGMSRTSIQSFVLVYCVYFVSTGDDILFIYMKCILVNRGDDVQLTICACCLWDMALNAFLDT